MIIGGIIALALAIAVFIYYYRTDGESIGYSIYFGAAAGFVSSFLIIALLWVSSSIVPDSETDYDVEIQELYAVKDALNGKEFGFFLFSGHTNDGDPVYNYVIKTEYGYEQKQKGVKHTYIVFDDDHPRLEIRTPKGFKHFKYWLYSAPFFKNNKYAFYIPENGLINEYNIDLE